MKKEMLGMFFLFGLMCLGLVSSVEYTDDQYKFPFTIGDYSLKDYNLNFWDESCFSFDSNSISKASKLYGVPESNLSYLLNTELCSKMVRLNYYNKDSLIVIIPSFYSKGKDSYLKFREENEFQENLGEELYSLFDSKDVGVVSKGGFDFIRIQQYSFGKENTVIPEKVDISNNVLQYFLNEYSYKNQNSNQENPSDSKEDSSACQLGFRVNQTYCTSEGSFVFQKEAELACENNFECQSNVCADSKCVSGSLISKILAWFKNIFG